MTTHDFEDGKDEVPAHRHVNPDGSLGGWVADTAYVDPTSYVMWSAKVYDDARVLENSEISTGSKVCGNNFVEANNVTWTWSTNHWMPRNSSLYNCV